MPKRSGGRGHREAENMRELAKLKEKSLRGKHVLLRLDLNVPIEEGRVIDRFRLDRALPTIAFLRKAGAKTIILSHLGRAGGSLLPVARELNSVIDAGFIPAPLREVHKTLRELGDGGVVLLENLRRDPGEEKGSAAFAKALAALGNIYVNDAFSVSHRKHASVYALPRLLPHYAGPLFVEEVSNLKKAFSPRHPFVLILGGAKFETKVPVLKRFLKIADRIVVVGAIAHAFFRAQGCELGKSRIDKSVSAKPFLRAVKDGRIILPSDALVSNGSAVEGKAVTALAKGDTIVDIGPQGIEELRRALKGAKMILWNGPSGNYESGYGGGTVAIARMIARSSAYSIVGGGDTVTAVQKTGLISKFDFVSTGGGAMLSYLATGTLPGIEALD